MINKILTFVILAMTLQADPKVIPVKTKQPEEHKVYPLVIVGAGAAGTMAVKRAVLNNTEVVLFTGGKKDQKNSCGHWVARVDNIPGLEKYQRTILEMRNEVLQDLAQRPLGQNLYIVEEGIALLEKQGDLFRLTDHTGRSYRARFVVLATGIMKEQPQIQGSIRPILKYANGQTVGYCCICDGHRCLGKKTAVIGHTETAAHIALFLVGKYPLPGMVILTNGKPHEFSPELLKELQEKKIVVLDAPIQDVLGDKELKKLSGFQLESGEQVDAEMGFVALGIRPNNQLALQVGAQVNECGLVVTNEAGESSIPNLFVIGDLRANGLKQIHTAWQHALDAVEEIDNRL